MTIIKHHSLILYNVLIFLLFMSWYNVGAERIKLLPDSTLTRYEKLVIRGRDTAVGEFPFQVSLQIKGHEGFRDQHLCGGTILDEYTVLTAAHCFDYVTPKEYKIVAGSNTLKGPHEITQTRLIDRLFIHPKYSQRENGIALINDIAIIRVQRPFTFNHYVNAARLPGADIYPEGDVQVTGWGHIDKKGGLPETLQVVDLPLLTQTECEAYVLERQHLKTGDWVKSLVCTKAQFGPGTPSMGDAGGPLVQDGEVVGVVSTGDKESTLAIYTRVSAFREWIDSKMSTQTNGSREVNYEL